MARRAKQPVAAEGEVTPVSITRPTRVIIIGAGWAGIIAAKTYLQVNPSITLTVLDANATVGGVWCRERCYPGFTADGPVGLFDYSDLPMREVIDLQDWDELPGIQVYNYLREYAHRFGILERCRLGTRVLSVTRSQDGSGWTLVVRSGGDDGQQVEEALQCDKLIVATGLCSTPRVPDVPAVEFVGPVMHSKEMGLRHQELAADGVKRVAVYGGGKSAVDAVNFCIESERHVDWVISDLGNGPGPMAETRLKSGRHIGQFTGRWKDIFSPSLFSVGTFWNWFFYSGKSRLGAWMIEKFWDKIFKKRLDLGPYKSMTPENREKLTPSGNSILFSAGSGSALHNCPRFLSELAKPSGLITVHRARIISLEKKSLLLSNGDVLPCDGVVFATGWSSKDDLFPPELGVSLGLPESPEFEDEATSKHWAELHVAADAEVTSILPILTKAPPYERIASQTQSRLYRYMLPTSLASRRDRSLVFVGHLTSIQTCIFDEVSALWAVAWMEDLIDLGVPSDTDKLEFEVAKVNAWSGRRYLSRGFGRPVGGAEIQLVVDTLMRDMGLKVHRKGGLGFADFFVPYRSQDYKGIVEDVLKRSTNEGRLRQAEFVTDSVAAA